MPQIIRLIANLKDVIKEIKKKNSSIGLVPTMGALHDGHLSLVQMSTLQYDVTVVTIFVNPTQFTNPKDLDKYPRSESNDIDLLRKTRCDIIFIPKTDEMYKFTPTIKLSFGYLETIMEGQHRPGHFGGVGLIVMKLFGLTEPNGAFFGQKDLQQLRVISSLINDFELPITLHMAPIIRETSGLALSSRNTRLTNKQSQEASLLFETLKKAEINLKNGATIKEVKKIASRSFLQNDSITLEYFEIVYAETLHGISTVNDGDRIALCVAALVAEIRLIDNIIIEI